MSIVGGHYCIFSVFCSDLPGSIWRGGFDIFSYFRDSGL